MAAKTERIEMRARPEQQARIAEAAEIMHESVSSFVLGAATAEADRVLARTRSTIMPAAQFDVLLQGLDVPDEAPRLHRLAASHRRFSRS